MRDVLASQVCHRRPSLPADRPPNAKHAVPPRMRRHQRAVRCSLAALAVCTLTAACLCCPAHAWPVSQGSPLTTCARACLPTGQAEQGRASGKDVDKRVVSGIVNKRFAMPPIPSPTPPPHHPTLVLPTPLLRPQYRSPNSRRVRTSPHVYLPAPHRTEPFS